MKKLFPLPVVLLYTLTIAFCIALVTVPTSCGASSASSRSATLHDTKIVMTSIQDLFLVWDAKHQKDIVDQAATQAEGAAALAAYRVTRDKIVAALDLAYNAIKLASSENDDPSLQAAIAAAAAIENDIKTLIGQTPAPAAKPKGPAPAH